MQMSRTLVVMSRAIPTVALNNFLLIVGMAAMSWAFPSPGLLNIFLKSGLRKGTNWVSTIGVLLLSSQSVRAYLYSRSVKIIHFAAAPFVLTSFVRDQGLLWMILCLAQSIAAQRIFGGEDRQVAWREASVCSPVQIVSAFIGKDARGN